MNRTVRILLPAAAVAAAAAFPLVAGPYLLSLALPVMIYMSLALSWYMLLRSGQISFGIAGFFGLGAYAAATAALHLGIPPLLSILVGGAVAFLAALLLGLAVLRLRGMYFAITTLAVAEIFRVVIRNGGAFTGGPEGQVLSGAIFGGNSAVLYWLMLAVTLLTLAASEAFQRTRLHFALTAIRNNEVSAEASGINIFSSLALAFAITSGLQGIIGGTYAQMYAFVAPDGSFSADFTLLPLAIALLGGIYGSLGPVLGALLLGILAEYLKLYVPYGHQIVYGLIIVLVVLFMPRGIVGLLRRSTGGKEAAR
jgi:branched-chain amino acid transport system permease protein